MTRFHFTGCAEHLERPVPSSAAATHRLRGPWSIAAPDPDPLTAARTRRTQGHGEATLRCLHGGTAHNPQPLGGATGITCHPRSSHACMRSRFRGYYRRETVPTSKMVGPSGRRVLMTYVACMARKRCRCRHIRVQAVRTPPMKIGRPVGLRPATCQPLRLFLA